METRKNNGNNGIYGRFPNSAETFGFLAMPPAELGHITGGIMLKLFLSRA